MGDSTPAEVSAAVAAWPTPFTLEYGSLQSQLSEQLVSNWHLWVSRRVATLKMVGAETIAVKCSADFRVPRGLSALDQLTQHLEDESTGPLAGPTVFLPVTCLPPVFSFSHLDAHDQDGRRLPILDRTGNDYLARGMLRHAMERAVGEHEDPHLAPIAPDLAFLLGLVGELRRTEFDGGASLMAELDSQSRRTAEGRSAGLLSVALDPTASSYGLDPELSSAVESARDQAYRSLRAQDGGGKRAELVEQTLNKRVGELQADPAVRMYLSLLAHTLPVHVAIDPKAGTRQIVKLSWEQTVHIERSRVRPGTWRAVRLDLPIFGAAETQHVQWVADDGTRLMNFNVNSTHVDPLETGRLGHEPGRDRGHIYFRFVDRDRAPLGVAPIGFAEITGKLIADRRALVRTYAALCLWNCVAVAAAIIAGPFDPTAMQVWIPMLVLVPGLVAAVLPLSAGPIERHLLAGVRHSSVISTMATVAACGLMVISTTTAPPVAVAAGGCGSALPTQMLGTLCVDQVLQVEANWADLPYVLLIVALAVITFSFLRPLAAAVTIHKEDRTGLAGAAPKSNSALHPPT